MIYAFGPNIGFYSALLVVQEGLFISFPFLVGALVQYFEISNSNNHSVIYGYQFAVLFGIATLLAGPLRHILMYKQQLNGLKLKVAVCGLMYKKAFKLNPSAMSLVSTGKLINLCSTDIARFEWWPQHLHFLVNGPVQFMITACILWKKVGIVTLSLVYIFFIMFMQTYFASLFTKLRRQTAKISDTRICLMSEILTGMRIIKMYAWEKPFEKLIYKIRKNEVSKILKSSLLRATNVFLQISAEDIMTFIAFIICIYEQQTMSPAQVFLLLGLFNNLKFTCGIIFPIIVTTTAESLVSVNRIEKVLSLPDNFNEDSDEEKHNKNETILSMSDVCARWDKDSKANDLHNISFIAPEGSLVAIVGPVGSGKSSILNCLLGDLPVSSGTKQIPNNVAYAPQLSWIFADTIRYNIVFNATYEANWYNEVVTACGLVKDFKSFKFGDLTLIGERGITLSGGQKARISLARAVYRTKNTNVFLLDDPLSAVDANVGQLLFEKCICGILKKKTRVLVTHQLQYLEAADKVIVLKQGEIIAQGSYTDVMTTSGTDIGLLHLKEDEEVESDNGFSETIREDKNSKKIPNFRKRRLTTVSSVESKCVEEDETVVGMEEEDIEEGSISNSVYYEYVKNAANIFVIIFLCLIMIIHEISEVMCMWWFGQWAENNLYVSDLNTSMVLTNSSLVYNGTSEALQQTNTPQSYYLKWFIAFLCLELVTAFVYTSLHYALTLRSSVKLHNSMFHSVLNTPIRFFDVNPSGRILNRFSKDIGQLDEMLPHISQDFIMNSFRVVKIFVVAAAINYVILLLILPMMIYFVWIRQYFMKTSRALKRMEGTTRSPVYSLLSETLQGLPTIRAFKLQNHLTKQFHKNQDVYGAAFELFSSSSRWFSVRLDIICAIFAGVTAITIVTVEHTFHIDSAKAGVVLINVMSLVDLVQWTVTQSAATESLMTSVERVITYSKLPPEESIDDVTKSDQNGNLSGSIKFVNVCYSHYNNGPYVLRNLEFCIKEREKIGIVGRTGAGKSSLLSTLFRMNELEKGDIFIDEVNIKTLPLNELRSSLSIIPQDPMLFTGTLRENLDPFSNYSDDELWSVLKQVQLQSLVVELPHKLNSMMHEAGSNLSVGQRQLVCLGRALLKDNKILVVDEATANVDLRTDQLIQKTIRENFSQCTVLTIAHRLNTIIDSDRVMVLDNGQVKEFDHPHLLLQNEDGMFYDMLKSTNVEQFSTLKEIAAKTWKPEK